MSGRSCRGCAVEGTGGATQCGCRGWNIGGTGGRDGAGGIGGGGGRAQVQIFKFRSVLVNRTGGHGEGRGGEK